MTILLYKDTEIVPNMGGIARINYNLGKALENKGFRIIYLSVKRNDKDHQDNHPLQLYLPNPNDVLSHSNIVYLKDLLVNESVDIIINSHFDEKSISLIEESRAGLKAKVITWLHNNIIEYSSLFGYRKELFFHKYKLTPLYWLLTRRFTIRILRHFCKMKHSSLSRIAYQKSDKIVTVSHGNIDDFLFLIGRKDYASKVLCINNFIPSTSESIRLNSKEKIVVWCGTVDFNLKKTNWMIDIWSMVEKEHNDWILYIIGDSAYLNDMKNYAQIMNTNRVRFMGRIEPADTYKLSSILCSTSITESFGLTILEGMRQKVVPIAFEASPSIKEIAEDCGFLIKPFDKIQYAKCLSKLMDDASLLNQVSKKCLTASMRYDEQEVVPQWLLLFEQLNNRK